MVFAREVARPTVPPRRLAGERIATRALGSEDGPQGGRRTGESLPAATGGLPAPGLHHGLQQPARRTLVDQERPGAEGPRVLRTVRTPGDRVPDRRADRCPSPYPGDR